VIIIDRPEGGNGPVGSFRMHTEAHRTRDPPSPVPADTPCEMDSAAKRRLGDIVLERNMVTPHQLQQALDEQRTHGGKLGETLVELGFITRVELAGVISEQWDDLRRCRGGETASPQPSSAASSPPAPAAPSAIEAALRERLEALTVELAARDQRIAQQDATINALLSRVTEVERRPAA
jgi:hypothetical protein